MTDKTSKQIAAKLRQIRKKKYLTQADVAEAAGITANYYARLERGEVKPSAEVIVDITRALKVKYSDILPS